MDIEQGTQQILVKTAKIPPSRSALIVSGPGQLELVMQAMPKPGPGQVLVRAACVALNPSDAKMVNAGFPSGSVAGLDFAGVVVAIGPPPIGLFTESIGKDDNPKEEEGCGIEIGSRVCSLAFGYNKDGGLTGAFADYILAETHLLVPVPKGMTFEEAATLPVGLITGGIVLFQELGLTGTEKAAYEIELGQKKEEIKNSQNRTVLVYGGSTASGLILIQLLKHAGFNPITVCSPTNFELVKSAGATAVFDYHTGPGDCEAKIREHTSDRLRLAIDCIASPFSMSVCYSALSRAESTRPGQNEGVGVVVGHSRYIALNSYPVSGHTRRAVRPSWVFAMSAFGKPVEWTGPYKCEARLGDRKFAAKWMHKMIPRLLEQGAIKPLAKIRVMGKLLVNLRDGLQLLDEGRVSGEKLIYSIGA
ncbi:hypothetical protein PspLS_11640 [Pyricularia sp. CBS 133598]|nr:hypothetical protein PspLS_11640 [Pyricularia sp. CBS 133598]